MMFYIALSLTAQNIRIIIAQQWQWHACHSCTSPNFQFNTGGTTTATSHHKNIWRERKKMMMLHSSSFFLLTVRDDTCFWPFSHFQRKKTVCDWVWRVDRWPVAQIKKWHDWIGNKKARSLLKVWHLWHACAVNNVLQLKMIIRSFLSWKNILLT